MTSLFGDVDASKYKKEFLPVTSYVEARRLAPWAVTIVWSPDLKGFWAWESCFHAQHDMDHPEPLGDLLITERAHDSGHAVRIYANMTPDEAKVRAKNWAKRGFFAQFTSAAGQMLWTICPPTSDIAGRIGPV